MADVSNQFFAEMPRRIRSDIGDLKLDVREIRTCVGHIETQVADLSSRMLRREEIMERILRRLRLRDSAPA